ncbi:MAG: GNAT family N-acetyltransferase [Candidatus Aenigmatarchaeota archaeon]
MTEIRKITEKDLQSFAVFVEELKKDANAELFSIDKVTDPVSWGRNGILLNANKAGVFLIAEEEGKIIGFCNIFRKDGRHECGIGLLSEFRGKRIGIEIIKAIIQEAKNIGIKKLYAGIKKANKVSIDFFKFNGFKIAEKKEKSLLLRKTI